MKANYKMDKSQALEKCTTPTATSTRGTGKMGKRTVPVNKSRQMERSTSEIGKMVSAVDLGNY